jgi:hypothetical protein
MGGRGQINVSDTNLTLSAGHSLGQTLTTTFAGLQGLRVYLSPLKSGDGRITLTLYSTPQKESVLAQAELPLAQIGGPGFQTFTFQEQPGSFLTSYYLELRVDGAGEVRAGSAQAALYLDGSLYQDGVPQFAQLSFLPLYSLSGAAGGIFREGLGWLGWLLAGAFLILAPGAALIRLLAGPWFAAQPLGSRISLAAAAGLGLYPILFLLSWLANLRVGILLAFLPGILGCIYLLALAWQKRAFWRTLSLKQFRAPDAAFLGISLVIVFTRLWAVRLLPLPMFGDSIHHTMITSLIIQNEGLFQSWLPLAELQSLTYHFGFHTFAAALHWVTGLSAAQSVLAAGQLLNILAVLAVYPLALKASGGSKWAGAAALLVAGCLGSMPMFYTNWGRYTQLAGQVILCGALCLVWEMFETPRPGWKLALLTGLTWGGLALTHYRVMIFAVLGVPGLVLLYTGRLDGRALWRRYRWLAAAGLLAGLIFLPWFLHVKGGGIFRNLVAQVTTPVQALSDFGSEYNAIGSLSDYLPILAWVALACAAAWGLWRRKKEVLAIMLWALLVLLAANPDWFRLPGSGALSNFAVFIAAYIFAAALVGTAAGWIAEFLAGRARAAGSLAMLALVLGLGVYFGAQRIRDLQPEKFALATWADLRAAAWIQTHTPADARFLVNSFSAYGGSTAVGSDGGWWLAQTAGRQSTQPPMIYSSEAGPDPQYAARVNALEILIEEKGFTAPETIQMLRDRGVLYAYIGQRGGRVNYGGPNVMDPAQMVASGNYEVIYHQDLVWVLKMRGNE